MTLHSVDNFTEACNVVPGQSVFYRSKSSRFVYGPATYVRHNILCNPQGVEFTFGILMLMQPKEDSKLSAAMELFPDGKVISPSVIRMTKGDWTVEIDLEHTRVWRK